MKLMQGAERNTGSHSPPPQAGCSRVFLLAEASDAAKVEALLRSDYPDVRVQYEPDYLMALGRAPAFGPDVVLAWESVMGSECTEVGRSLRRVTPNAKLVLVSRNGAPSHASVGGEAAFDEVVPGPLNSATLSSIFGPASNEGLTSDTDLEIRLTDRAISRRVDAVSNDSAARPEQMPGDIDLVQAIMIDGSRVPAIAMRIIAEQSGIIGLGLVEHSEDAPSGSVQVPVLQDGFCFGQLHAAKSSDVKQLRRWAGWLGHWLMLKRHVGGLWQMALKDDLTGAWNRRYFNRFVHHLLDRATKERFRVTVLVFDIDDFKVYNDKYGHAAGDEILRETAKLMQSVVREHDVVARIGGDEFAVIFWDAEAPREEGSEHPQTVRRVTERFRRAICAHRFPKLLDEAPGTLTISAGIAGFPWDGRTPDELVARADEMAMQSKRQGKNAVTFGPGAIRDCDVDGGG